MNMIKPVLGGDGPIIDKILFRGAPPIRHSHNANPSFKSGHPIIYAMRPIQPDETLAGTLDLYA